MITMAYFASSLFKHSLSQCKSFTVLQNKTRQNEREFLNCESDSSMLQKAYFAGPRLIHELHIISENDPTLRQNMQNKLSIKVFCSNKQDKSTFLNY